MQLKLNLSDSFLFCFLYYNGHASILIDQLSPRNVKETALPLPLLHAKTARALPLL